MKLLILSALFSIMSFAKVSADKAWIRLMPPSSDVTAGFVVFKNDGKTVAIESVKASFAKDIELHTHVLDEGIMQMRKVEKMKIPAQGELVLKPHGKHIMFFGIKALKAGDKKEVEFKLSDGSSFKASFEVRGMKDGE